MPSRTGAAGGGYSLEEYDPALSDSAYVPPPPDNYVPGSTYVPPVAQPVQQAAPAGMGYQPNPYTQWQAAPELVPVPTDPSAPPVYIEQPAPVNGQDRGSYGSERAHRKLDMGVNDWLTDPVETGQVPWNPQAAQTDASDAFLGAMRTVSGYLRVPQGQRLATAAQDVGTYFAPVGGVSPERRKEAQQRLPDTASYLAQLGRYVYYGPPTSPYSPESNLSTDDRYLGQDPRYQGMMLSMPEYLRPYAPWIAKGAHAIANLPAAPLSAPPSPPDPAGHYDFPDNPEQFWLIGEPGAYYDDPFIPGPDKGYQSRRA